MDDETGEFQRAVVMFPKFAIWLLSGMFVGLASLGGAVVAQQKGAIDKQMERGDRHEIQMGDHETRLRMLERSQQELKETTRETNYDVKRLLELQMRREGRENRSTMPRYDPERRLSP